MVYLYWNCRKNVYEINQSMTMIGNRTLPSIFYKGLLVIGSGTTLLWLTGCAYFNTYYNANRLYSSASKDHRQFPDTVAASPSARENLRKAIDKYAQVAVKYPNSRWVLPSLYHMGSSYYLMGEFDKAERKYQEILQYYPNSRYALMSQLNQALISYRMRQWDKALWELSRIREGDPRTIQQAAFLEALVKQSMADQPRAAIAWESFLYRHYRSRLATPARYNYALVLISLGETSNAARELELLLDSRLKKDFRYQASLLLAQCYRESGRPDQALAIYRHLQKGRPDQAKIPRLELEMAHARATNLPPLESSSEYKRLAAKYPKTEISAEALFQVAKIFETQQQPDSALEYYNRARSENPSPVIREAALKKSADLSLLLAYRQQSDQQAAEQSSKLQFLMAEHYLFALSRPDSAVASYRRVAENFSEQPLAPKAWYAAAWVSREHLGRNSESDSILRLIIERYPNTRYANGAREQLGLPIDTTISDAEPNIEVNLKPIEDRPSEPTRPDSIIPAGRHAPGEQEPPTGPTIPGPDLYRTTK